MRLPKPILIALLVLTALPVTMSAAQGSGTAGALGRPPAKSGWGADRKNPYSRLFTSTIAPTAAAATQAQPAVGKPEVKCGMTMIPIEPSIDPRMVVPPLPSSTRFTIRAIDPPTCR